MEDIDPSLTKIDFTKYRNIACVIDLSEPPWPYIWELFEKMLESYLQKKMEHLVTTVREMEVNLDTAFPMDVIIVDGQLEDYVGKDILKLLIARKVRIPVILFEGRDSIVDKKISLADINIDELNIAGRLKKPVDLTKLFDMIIGAIIENQKNNEGRKFVKDPKKVLLAVADDAVRNELSDILSTVLLKGDVSRADDIGIIKKAFDEPKQPDLIVIDTQPSDALARDILKLLLSYKSKVPVIFIESRNLDISGININEINVAAHIVRPIDRMKEFCIFDTVLMGKEWVTFPTFIDGIMT